MTCENLAWPQWQRVRWGETASKTSPNQIQFAASFYQPSHFLRYSAAPSRVFERGRLRISHDDGHPVVRRPDKAGGTRFHRGVPNPHGVQNLDGIASEYIRIELKPEPVDLPEQDI